MTMTKRFLIAAYMSIANAVLILPLLAASFFLGIAEASGAISGFTSRFITAAISIPIYGIAIYVLIALRQLFEQRYNYKTVSPILTFFIWVYAVFIVISTTGIISSALETAVGILSLLASILIGVLSIVYGIKLLSFEDDLYGYRKRYANIEIATGVCFASVLLLPIGLLLNIASNIFLAIIFYREAETMTRQQENP